MPRTRFHSSPNRRAKALGARRVCGFVCVAAALLGGGSARAEVFTKPTAAELSMTSLPGHPGVPAFILFHEQVTRDDMHSVQEYERVKILTEEGAKKYANVELSFFSSTGDYYDEGDNMMIEDIVGRTIHPDGTVIPFTGKPYLKVIEKENRYKVQEKVFTLPDVQVGSIVEYRFARRYNDHVFEAPDWYVQDELFVKQAHFLWYPTVKDLTDGETSAPINSISWFPILPAGVKIDRREQAGTPNSKPQQVYELNAKDIAPMPREEFMPPVSNYSYRVLFNFTQYRSGDEYWRSEGKRWSKRTDKFARPTPELSTMTGKITAGATTSEAKLRAIYAKVMTLENTEYTRNRSESEAKASGGKVMSAEDVLTHGVGTANEITETFVAMARAAGLNAYLMLVPDRNRHVFTAGWMNFRQFDDLIAIVNVDGKDVFLDPGSRYTPFGSLAWQHSPVAGVRQTDSGTAFAETPAMNYTKNLTARVANLTMDDHGEVKGTISLTFTGAPAVHWRQEMLTGDDESLRRGLRVALEEMLPKTLEVKVGDIADLNDYEKPLSVKFEVHGSLGSAAGKRVLLPADIFEAGSSATFKHDTRELAVEFHYPELKKDAFRLNIPKSMSVEATPSAAKLSVPQLAIYNLSVAAEPTSFTTRREYACNDTIIPATGYGALHTFYSQFQSKDQESVVLKLGAPEPSPADKASN